MKRIKQPPAVAPAQIQSPTEQTELTGTGAKAISHQVHAHPVPSTAENELAVASAYPQLGDEVRIDVDRVPYMERGEIHNRIIASSANGQLGRVAGSEVIGGVYMLRVHCAHADILVPADCCALEAHPITPVQEGSKAPDTMHKPSTGSYKLT
jgi:hypothetical protein